MGRTLLDAGRVPGGTLAFYRQGFVVTRQGGRSVRKLIACGVALVAALALTVPGALGSAEQTTGRHGTFDRSRWAFAHRACGGLCAPIPLGMKAYFAYVNARKGPDGKRGVMGRQIVWKYYDNAYNTATSLQLARRLVQEDKVFATVGDLGTEPVQASRSYMNGAKVPQVFVSTGASEFGTKYKEFPWTIGWQPDYISEGRLYGLHVKANQRGKKIAIIYQNDDYGKDYLYGFKYALGPAYVRANVIAQEAIEASATSAASQMTRIRASGAQVRVIFQLPTPTVRTIGTARALGYNPDQIYMNSVATVKPATDGIVATVGAQYANGIISAAYVKDPNSPTWSNDPAMALQGDHREVRRRSASSRRPGLLRGRQGGVVRPGSVQGGQEPHPPAAHERGRRHEPAEQVPAPERQAADVEDRSLRRSARCGSSASTRTRASGL